MRASGSAYQPGIMGLPALVSVLVLLDMSRRGNWRTVAVIVVRESIASGRHMEMLCWMRGREGEREDERMMIKQGVYGLVRAT